MLATWHIRSQKRQVSPSIPPVRSVFSPAFLPGSGSLQEGHGCLDHDGFSVCSPSAIRLVSGCDQLAPAMFLCISEAVLRWAGCSTFDIRSSTRKKTQHTFYE